MKPLTLDLHSPQDDLLVTSPAFQLFASGRRAVKAATLLAMLDAGWPMDLREVSPPDVGGRSLLLQYLGSFDPLFTPSENLTQPVEQADLDAEQALLRTPGAPMRSHFLALIDQGQRVAQRLLDAGADPWARDTDGRDALDQAVALGWLPLVDALLRRPDVPPVEALARRTLFVAHVRDPQSGSTSRYPDGMELPWLHATAAHAHHPLLDRLIDHGLPVNGLDTNGRSALFHAPFDGTAQLLLRRGIDPMIVDTYGQTAGQAWPALLTRSAEKAPMQATFKDALLRSEADPAAMYAQQARTLFTMAINDPRDAMVRFMRENGLNVTVRLPGVGGPEGMSLLGYVAMHAIGQRQRSRAIAQYVLKRLPTVKDRAFESLPGVPDVWLAFLASTDETSSGAVDFRGETWAALHEHYGLGRATVATVEAHQRLLDDGLVLMQRAMGGADPTVADLSGQRNPREMANLWAEVMVRLASHARDDGGAENPARTALQSLNAQGQVRAWAWMEHLVGVYEIVNERLFTLDRAFNALTGEAPKGLDGGPQGLTPPLVPLDSLAVNALIATLGVPSKPRTTPGKVLPAEPLQTWNLEHTTHRLMQRAMLEQVPVDTLLPTFERRFERVQRHQPFLAQRVEQQVLRSAVTPVGGQKPETADAAVVARARSRL